MKNPCICPSVTTKKASPHGKPRFNGGRNPLQGYRGARNPAKK